MDMLENLIFWGMTLTVVGKAIVIYAALAIHGKIIKEKQIDQAVIQEYKRERLVIVFGLAFIISGYILEILGLELFIF